MILLDHQKSNDSTCNMGYHWYKNLNNVMDNTFVIAKNSLTVTETNLFYLVVYFRLQANLQSYPEVLVLVFVISPLDAFPFFIELTACNKTKQWTK